MKFGKVYNYKNAKKLVSVTEGITYPFRVASYNTSERFDYQFIREIIEASTKERKK